MGCHGSKEETPTCQAPRKMWKSFPPSTPSSAQRRLIEGLQDLKRQMDEESGGKESFSFTKIILKLGTIEKMLRRINAVFKSVDHGNKGHVTKDELKEGLRRAHVDLGDEWEDTNIDDCLQHLQGRDDKVGLREFVVMLAVGRVCRPLKRRSSVFVPLQEEQEGGGATEGGLRMDDIFKKTIEENEVRRPSMTVQTDFTLQEAAAAAAAEVEVDEAAEEAKEAAEGGAKHEPRSMGEDDDSKISGSEAAAAAAAAAAATPAAQVADPVPLGRAASGGGASIDEAPDTAEERAAEVVAAAAKHGGDANGRQGRAYASAGPGGLPRGSSWRNIKWAQIPSLMSIDTSVRGLSRGLSRSGRSNSATGGRGGAGKNEVDVSMSVKYVLDLFIAAYFQFDKEGRGFITKSTIEKTLRKSENEPGVSGLLDKKRWSEAAWDGDRLSFQEFIYAFSLWLGLLEDDVDGDDDDKPYQHRSPQATPRAAAPVATAAVSAAAAAAAGEGDDGGGSS
ncbi:unnamed protein product [Ectocarpus sp. 8 AP-2014]